jgi:hypothetical protein
MKILSATEAVSPAIERTKLVLFTPFRVGRTWKLGATAYLATAGTVFCPLPAIYLFFLRQISEKMGPTFAAWAAVGLVVMTALILWIFFLCSRLQFAFFDIVLNRGEFVAPAWRKYGPVARRFALLKVVLGTVGTAAMAVPVAAYVVHLIPIIESLQPGAPPPPEFIAAMFAGYGVIFFGFGSLFLISALLCDFMIPSLALESTTLQEAFTRMMSLVRREPGQFTAYVFMKLLLAIAGYMGGTFVFEIVLLLVTLIFGVVVGLCGLLLHLVHVPLPVLFVLGAVIVGGFEIALGIYGGAIFAGCVLTFLQAYTLYFLGGRYPMLGELLERSTPVTMMMPPPSYGAPYFPPTGTAG